MLTAAQIKAEITNDPKGLGYAAKYTVGDDTGVAKILNSPHANPDVVWNPNLQASAILGSLVDTEVAAWTVTQWTAFSCLISTGTVDATNARIRALFSKLLATAPQSLNFITAVAQITTPTRAEELGGAGTVVAVSQIADARNS